MPTISLQLITETITPKIKEQIESFAPYFDKVYVQINGKDARKVRMVGNVFVSRFEWCDDFAAARNALWEKVDTDYTVWADTDDTIQGLEDLPFVIDHMQKTGTDLMYFPYIYATDADGNPTEVQNRERIIRTSLPGMWHGSIHETWIPEVSATRETSQAITWVHRKSKAEHDESMLRNRRILEREYRTEPRDPRIAYYLGLNYGISGDYSKAIDCFQELIETGGWDEERYRAYLQIFSCYFELKNYDQAASAALEATKELPDWPDAYFMLQQLYYQVDDHEKSLEWFKVGRSKPNPQSDSAFNPHVRLYQPLKLAAYSYMAVGKPQVAMKTLLELQKANPHYPIEEGLKQVTLDAVNEERAVEAAKYLIDFNQKYEGDALAVLKSLPPILKGDVRLTDQRRELIPGKVWPKGSIAIYCGPSFETWGPDTLEQGMGGSEEAIVYLAREFALQRVDEKYRKVHVFNERSSSYEDQVTLTQGYDEDYAAQGNNAKYYASSREFVAIDYHPWTEINPNDTFDTFVAWRSPAGLENINARVKILDLHDVMPLDQIYAALPYVDYYFFKSSFHRELYPELPEEKCKIIGNGIKVSQFK